ncbi:uncharacterized protein LOC117899974 [Drosophila subobscura]|uniref:uncharacterized protein LOC117899974 n=1 Tax=Drosophila subobscura TaxID=7241 RepID=UPI00155B3EC8|nr:uncharacterized protein LOC117899974 [Drosophila subobscura]
MLQEVVALFILSSVFFFVAHVEKPTSFSGYKDAACPIAMGILAAGLVYKNR